MNELWPTRRENEVDRRRARAQAHLARRRGGVQPRLRRGPRIAVAALAALAGFAFGAPLAEALLGVHGRSVHTLAVHGARAVAPAAIAERSGIAHGADLGSVEATEVATALELEPWILHARALALPSGTVVLAVEERIAAALTMIDGASYAVDREGRAFATVAAEAHPNLPQIEAEALKPAEPDARLAQAVALAERLPAYGIESRATVHVAAAGDPEGFALALPGVPARIVLGDEPEARLAALAELVARRPDAVAMATAIDLRFANQVVLRTAPTRDGSDHNAAARGRAKPSLGPPTG
jgi:cell division septal protein FtsQ